MIGVLAGAGIMVALMQTLVLPVTPSLPTLLGTTTSGASWVVTITLLVAAISTAVVGRLGDMYGKKRLILICIGFVVAGSVICAMSSSLIPVICGRALQGVGLAMIPMGISLMRDVLPAERLGSGLAFMSSSLGVGGALGLPASAAIAHAFGWHALFWLAGGLAAVFGVLIWTVIPESSLRVAGRIDVVGVIGLAAGLGALLLGISKGGDWGWVSPVILILLGGAVLILLAWGWWELRTPSPLVDIRTSARKPVLMVNLAAVGVGLAMYAMNLLSPQLLQLPTETGFGLGLNIMHTGLWMAPAGLAMMLFSQIAARLSAARGAKVTLLVGITIVGVGNVFALSILGHLWGVVVFTITVSIGVAFAYAAMPQLIISAVDPSETGQANGLNSLARTLGTSTASAIIGTVLGQFTVMIGNAAVPSETGVQITLVIGIAAALIALLLAFLIPSVHSGGKQRKPAAA